MLPLRSIRAGEVYVLYDPDVPMMRECAARSEVAHIERTPLICIANEQGDSHALWPGGRHPSTRVRPRQGGQERRGEDGCHREWPGDLGVRHRRPHATERRKVELVTEGGRGEGSRHVPIVRHSGGATRAEGKMGLHEQTPCDVSLRVNISLEAIQRRVGHEVPGRRKKLRSVRRAAWTRDFTVPAGTLRA